MPTTGEQTSREELIAKLLEIQGGKCFVGGELLDPALVSIEIDHIIPRAKGGRDEENNYAALCEYHNRNKLDSDLRVARCMARYESIKERYSAEGPNRPNLGDFLREFGGAQAEMKTQQDDSSLKYSLPLTDSEIRTAAIVTDKMSTLNSVFVELPIEYLFHDDRINPRAVGPRIRGLIDEFLKGRPQLQVPLGWATIGNGSTKVHIFDGQHKVVAQMLLGVRKLPVRVFLNPDLNVLLEANTNAGTVLHQIAFDKATQRFLGSQIYWEKVDEYRKAMGKPSDDLSFSEQDLVAFFKGIRREIRRYIADDVRVTVVYNPDNKLRDYIEFGGRGVDKPLSYSTIEKTLFSMFIRKEPLSTLLNYKLEIEENPRQLEKEQLVELMNILAEEIFIGKYDFDIGTSKVEERVRKDEPMSDDHLRAIRISREEVFYNCLRYVRDLIRRYFLMRGEVVEEEELFQRKFPEDLWRLIRKLINNVANLPLWVNRAFSSWLFGGKQGNEYWKVIFDTGMTRANQTVLAKPLNLDELIK